MVGSWDPHEQMATVTVTLVLATFVLVTFVHIRNVSAVTDQIYTWQSIFVSVWLVAENIFEEETQVAVTHPGPNTPIIAYLKIQTSQLFSHSATGT